MVSTRLLIFALGVLLVACGGKSSTPARTATPGSLASATPAATSVPSATPTATSAPNGAPAAPTNVTVTGALPDLRTPVPPGQGELGRITVSWQDNSNNETGFRVYQSCSGQESPLLEVDANTSSYGPLQVCRPGRVGVAAFNANGTSSITYTP